MNLCSEHGSAAQREDISTLSLPAVIEIERRFLPDHLPAGLESHPHEEVRQGYLPPCGGFSEVRIRQEGQHCYQNSKGDGTLSRVETPPRDLTPAEFEDLWPQTEGRRIFKVRYKVPFEGHVIEVNVFKGHLAGLVMAEVEFKSEEAAGQFVPPAWLGKEVTEDHRYKNRNLAVSARPELKSDFFRED